MAVSFARTLPAAAGELPGLIDAIEAWLEQASLPPTDIARLMIAIDEILSNIVTHGGGTISVTILLDDHTLVTTIVDDGPPFDPLARPAPDVDLDIADRPIGGLGIHLVREMMDDVGYAYENGRNTLTFGKTF